MCHRCDLEEKALQEDIWIDGVRSRTLAANFLTLHAREQFWGDKVLSRDDSAGNIILCSVASHLLAGNLGVEAQLDMHKELFGEVIGPIEPDDNAYLSTVTLAWKKGN